MFPIVRRSLGDEADLALMAYQFLGLEDALKSLASDGKDFLSFLTAEIAGRKQDKLAQYKNRYMTNSGPCAFSTTGFGESDVDRRVATDIVNYIAAFVGRKKYRAAPLSKNRACS
jgi:hypothetical protein